MPQHSLTHGEEMKAPKIRFPAIVLVLLALAACGKSRIDNVVLLDACRLVSAGEAERVLGNPAGIPVAMPDDGAFAGGCAWPFKENDADARLTAYVMTMASAENANTTPKRWFENRARVGEMKVTLGEPIEVRKIGDIANLYGSTLEVRQGDVVIMLHVDRGGREKLEEFARLLLSRKH
jgi:hypothetical protein